MNHVAIWVLRVVGIFAIFAAVSGKGGAINEVAFLIWLLAEVVHGLRVKNEAEKVEGKGGENE